MHAFALGAKCGALEASGFVLLVPDSSAKSPSRRSKDASAASPSPEALDVKNWRRASGKSIDKRLLPRDEFVEVEHGSSHADPGGKFRRSRAFRPWLGARDLAGGCFVEQSQSDLSVKQVNQVA